MDKYGTKWPVDHSCLAGQLKPVYSRLLTSLHHWTGRNIVVRLWSVKWLSAVSSFQFHLLFPVRIFPSPFFKITLFVHIVQWHIFDHLGMNLGNDQDQECRPVSLTITQQGFTGKNSATKWNQGRSWSMGIPENGSGWCELRPSFSIHDLDDDPSRSQIKMASSGHVLPRSIPRWTQETARGGLLHD